MSQDKQPPWEQSAFADTDDDPLSGFANIMDVMLVFALGLMLALLSQSQELQKHFNGQEVEVKQHISEGKMLNEVPQTLENALEQSENGGKGMQSLGQVYRDPKTGKLILIEHNGVNK